MGLYCAILFPVVVAAYSPIIGGYFIGDDFGIVQLYLTERLHDWPHLWATAFSQGIWGLSPGELRPVVALSYLWDTARWNVEPAGYHATNVFIHAVNAVMVAIAAEYLLGLSVVAAVFAGSIFALHPVHAEAVSWISGRSGLIATTFYLGSLLAFGRYRDAHAVRWYVVTLLMVACSLFSKEIAISVPLMLVAYDWAIRHKRVQTRWRRWGPHLGTGTVLAAYLATRWMAFGTLAGGQDDAASGFVARHASYVAQLLPPLAYMVHNNAWSWLLAAVAAAALVLYVRRTHVSRQPHRIALGVILFSGPVWYIVSTLPLYATYISPRHLYLPSVGICVVLGLALSRLVHTRGGVALTAGLVVLFSGLLLRAEGRSRAASELSRSLTVEIDRIAEELPEGSALILDAPGRRYDAYVWAWALPFALEPPFVRAGIYERFRVLEAPDLYCCQWLDDKRPLLRDLIVDPTRTYLVAPGPAGHLAATALLPERVSAGARALLDGAEWEGIWTAGPQK